MLSLRDTIKHMINSLRHTAYSRFNKLQGPAEKVCYIQGMPKAIAKVVVCYLERRKM